MEVVEKPLTTQEIAERIRGHAFIVEATNEDPKNVIRARSITRVGKLIDLMLKSGYDTSNMRLNLPNSYYSTRN